MAFQLCLPPHLCLIFFSSSFLLFFFFSSFLFLFFFFFLLFFFSYFFLSSFFFSSSSLLSFSFISLQLPFVVLVAFGSYSLLNIGLSLLWFRECPEAFKSLQKEIEEAKKDLGAKGISVN